jgi:steroid 5-alpha reductase family enzyme
MTKNTLSITGILGALIVTLSIATIASMQSQDTGLPSLVSFVMLAFIIQWLAFIPAYAFQTEKYFDLLGSLTYIILATTALSMSSMQPGSIAIAAMVTLWALRLGSFLYGRVRQVGHDTRFRSIKPDFFQFLMTWTLQGMWVSLTFCAGLTALLTAETHPLDVFVVAGCGLWLAGFMVEVIADRQKTAFRLQESNSGKFIQHGLWAWSRHPNYFGEILLWTGISVAAFPVLEGLQLVTLISPIFVFLLLTKISGVRMLEAQARRRWGDDPEYKLYLQRTPTIMLNPFVQGGNQGDNIRR